MLGEKKVYTSVISALLERCIALGEVLSSLRRQVALFVMHVLHRLETLLRRLLEMNGLYYSEAQILLLFLGCAHVVEVFVPSLI